MGLPLLKNTAVLVATYSRSQSYALMRRHISELELLGRTLGLRHVAHFYQHLEKQHANTLIGKGKIEEIKEFLGQNQESVVIFDDDLTPTQLRNLERTFKTHVYDRSLLILDIFLARAQSSQARLQVNLARYEYLLPRLTRQWTHLERQRGGLKSRGGAGEKELETDRRQIRNRITVLKKSLLKVEKQNRTQRSTRNRVVRIALVGYTNAGKSSLMHALIKDRVSTADSRLFATIDTTVRRLSLQNQKCLLSDTVGFIRKLPHGLIECFKSTLAEAKEADLLLHVADSSHDALDEQIEVVENTLQEIGIFDIPMILVLNKCDLVASASPSTELEQEIGFHERIYALRSRCRYTARHYGSAHCASDVKKLREVITKEVQNLAKRGFSAPLFTVDKETDQSSHS